MPRGLIKKETGLYVYEKTGIYWAVIKVKGRTVSQNLETTSKTVARQKLAVIRSDLSRYNQSRADYHTIAGLAERYKEQLSNFDRKTKQTLESIARILIDTWPEGPEHRLTDILPSHVTTWLGKHSERIKPATYNKYIRFIRGMFDMAYKDGAILKNPAQDLKYKRIPSPIRLTPTFDQFRAIIADLRSSKRPQGGGIPISHSADFLEFMGLFGVGNSEAANLKLEHINFEKEEIILFRNKTDVGYVIPIYPWGKELLSRLADEAKDDGRKNLFRIQDSGKALANSCRRLKFPHFDQRSLRRMFIYQCKEKGIHPEITARWQGHKDPKLIMTIYSSGNDEFSKQMAKRLTASVTPETPTDSLAVTPSLPSDRKSSGPSQ